MIPTRKVTFLVGNPELNKPLFVTVNWEGGHTQSIPSKLTAHISEGGLDDGLKMNMFARGYCIVCLILILV